MLDLQYDIPEKEVRKWASFCHFGVLPGVVLIPYLGAIVAPLVIWLAKRDEHFYIEEQGRESLNFQLTMTIVAALVWTVVQVLKLVWIGHLLTWAPYVVCVMQVLLSIVGGIRAWDGEKFRYPFSIPFINP